MKALVAGGAGFIGSHLCDALLARGYEVTALDNLVTGSRANLREAGSNPGFCFSESDVTQSLPQGEFDAIFHLASPASPVGYAKWPIETLMTNALGTHRLLELARRSAARFLLASTSEVYGDPLEHPQREEYWGNVNPVGPRSMYDEGKRFAEALTVNYLRRYGLDVRIVRIFNTYGPRNQPEDGRIIPNLVAQALRPEPLTVFGDGRQTRSYCYVSDLVEGLIRAMEGEGTRGEVFNLGGEEERSALEIAHLILRLAGSSSPVVHQPAREEEIARRRPDIAKARRVLCWEPLVGLEEGLVRTIEWFRSLGVGS